MRATSDIQNVLFINLERRTDRKQMFLEEFKKLGWATQPKWFKAVELETGAFGCTISHIKCLELAKKMGWPHVLVCEDDIKFISPSVFTENLERFLASGIDWDVILFAGNNVGQYRNTDNGAVKIQMCQTTTGYLVKSEYYDILIQNFKEGLYKFMKEPNNPRSYAIDRYWFSLQMVGKWYLIFPLTVTQQSVYSDIENKNTNYDLLMLTLDKSDWFKRK
jgi:GR25 family glycosyltransferase involved in LPS biosynthesis